MNSEPTGSMTNEQRFIGRLDALEAGTQDVDESLRSLDAWLTGLSTDLHSRRLAHTGFAKETKPAREADAIDTLLQDSLRTWSQQWEELLPAHTLADTFHDQVVLLVFGKFNSGKSSFCNFLADRFAAHGKPAHYFHVSGGRIVETAQRLDEGATETTARLQGVRLGDNLVLLDTPGLHSVTRENAALTQRFTESADALLWLTSSASPGQVQELEQLSRELRRNKPLLPVITRSDFYDEDEIDGEICKRLCNKSARNRAMQEADVETRAREKLHMMGVDVALLRAPLSVSSHTARAEGVTPTAMADAGFERLFASLLASAEPTLAYKARKQAEIRLHHMEENVAGWLVARLLPLLTALQTSLDNARLELDDDEKQITQSVWRHVVPTLPGLIEEYAAERDWVSLIERYSQAVSARFIQEARATLGGYVIDLSDLLPDAEPLDIGDLIQQGNLSDEKLYNALQQATLRRLQHLTRTVTDPCRESIQRLAQRADRLSHCVRDYEQRLFELKRELREETA
ncbi:dynamin family protein [Paraburkholderia sp. BCC1886]|uniref:dynamin family protein n=1 Tax=Paraburkholderia sp. BCC1886 TaxID=2562670 RepID=UPI0021B1E2C6|nr:dynamin family protein [Paraburkholderia sp. BCC1886]